MDQPPRPERIQAIQQGSQDWFALLAGMQLDLFTPLADRALSAPELAGELGADAGKLSLLLYALVVAGLLTVQDGRFALGEEAAQFLVRGRPVYLGSAHTLWAEFGQAGLRTAESVRTGVAQAKHDYPAMTEAELLATLGGLHAGALGRGRALAGRYDFGACRALLDAGGGSGGLSIALAEACPELRATVAELPNVVPVARRFVAEAGLADRIDAVAVDLLREPVPGAYDAAVLSFVTQVLGADDARAVLRTVARSLRPGGAVYLIAQMLDDSRLTPAAAARLNVIFLNFYDGGQAYTEGEYRAWLADAGFVDISREPDLAGSGLIRARLPV